MIQPKTESALRKPKPSCEAVTHEEASILLVDDQSARLLTYESILEPVGVRCVRAHSGEEALGCLLQEKFALILLDVSMPGMDGFETARLIRQHPRFEMTPIIFVTGVNVTELDALKGYDAGAMDYILVPVVPAILRSKVAVLVELYRKRRELDRANEAKGRFLAYASHDLRQPLQVAHLYLAELSDRVDKSEQRELCDLIQRSFDEMTEILEALIDISRLERGQVSVQVSDIDVGEMIQEIIDTYRSQADQKGLQLTARSCEGFVRSDPMLLKRVVDNFVSNAIRYTDAGEVTVHCYRDDSHLRISVSDTGKGIPADKLETIFEEYVQLNNPARTGGKGLGLGLAIVKHISKILGHRIAVTSSLGKGSTFSVEIPS